MLLGYSYVLLYLHIGFKGSWLNYWSVWIVEARNNETNIVYRDCVHTKACGLQKKTTLSSNR